MSNTTGIKQETGYFHWLGELDRILRGEATRPLDIQTAEIRIPIFGITMMILLLAVFFGFCMGVFALVRGIENSQYFSALQQVFASMCKVPILFALTLLVTFPSLYVFNALVGSQLKVLPVLKLLIASLAVNLAVLASLGPILAFFSVSTTSYPFIVLLNVVVFATAGLLGLIFLVQTLNRLTYANRGELPATQIEIVEPVSSDASSSIGLASRIKGLSTGPLDRIEGLVLGNHVRKVFACWICLFGVVGAQMGWVLRPFIGSPDREFQWLRARESNFFEAVSNTIQSLFVGG